MFSGSVDYFREYEPQIFQFWDNLSETQRKNFENELMHINIKTLADPKKDHPHITYCKRKFRII